MKRIIAGLFACACLCVLQVPGAQAATEKVLYSFCSASNCTDGSNPIAGLVAVNNLLYGTTEAGGNGVGTIFSFDPQNGTFKTLYSFAGGNDGETPHGDLISAKGILYGTTQRGGASQQGTAFAFDPSTGMETTLHAFGAGSDGEFPLGKLLYVKGILYGATLYGGTGCAGSGCGTIFAINTKSGVEQVLYQFCGQTCSDGSGPAGDLIAVNGTIYGVTQYGGTGTLGTVFSFNIFTGVEKILYSFVGGADGQGPEAGLVAVKNTLYGTTFSGGSGCTGCGTVYSVNITSGSEKVLHAFSGGTDSSNPESVLLKVKKELYGAARQGGGTGCSAGAGCGTVFGVSEKSGAEKILYSFKDAPDGSYPNGPLVEIAGIFYGTTTKGGTADDGTIFSITP